MLDLKFIRENPQKILKAIKDRSLILDLDKILSLDEERRKILTKLEELRHKKNIANEEISNLLKERKNPQQKIDEIKEISKEADKLKESLKSIETELNRFLLFVPNIPDESVPVGKDPQANKIMRYWGELPKFDFTPLTHLELSEHLDIIDFNRASKIAGSNFALFKGEGAKLERALINFMLDLHTKKHGYTEVFVPHLVNRQSMTSTGQLPKLELDMYRLHDDDYFLIPTAEVPVTNIYRNEILDEENLPKYFTAYTPCYRREAGSYGKETKGLMRVHQFDKVELVKFVRPQDSYNELESLLRDAEEVLQLLGLPYRVVLLSTEGLSFAASKCYDLEAYAAGMDKWLEVSSCSNFSDFQARRANIRYREKDTKKIAYLHTLNGSGVALARTVICILENYQEKDGTITIPEVLRVYMEGKSKIG